VVAAEFEKLAYEAALRGLDKQENLFEELRARTGVLLAAASLAASFLGQQAFRQPNAGAPAGVALVAFLVAIVASIFILMPKEDLVFSLTGAGLYEGLHKDRDDIGDVYRQLAYAVDRFWESNSRAIAALIAIYKIGAGALVVEIISLAILLGGNLL
jgi:hypothetical protein